jgi:exodeoxyribonuclease VII large subunit
VSRRLAAGQHVLTELRTGLGAAVVTRISWDRERLGGLRIGIVGTAAARISAARREQSSLAGRLRREAVRPVAGRKVRLENLATQARLLDPERLLARGFTITSDSRGLAITTVAALAAGDIIDTRFSDGSIRSLVQSGGGKASTKGKGKPSDRKKTKHQKNTGQKTLFR